MAGFNGSTGVSQKQLNDAVSSLNQGIESVNNTSRIDNSVFTTKHSLVHELRAYRSGNVVNITCTIKAGVKNGEVLLGIPDSIAAAYGNWTAPLIKASGSIYSDGSVWIFVDNYSNIVYYGTETTSQLYFQLNYLVE